MLQGLKKKPPFFPYTGMEVLLLNLVPVASHTKEQELRLIELYGA